MDDTPPFPTPRPTYIMDEPCLQRTKGWNNIGGSIYLDYNIIFKNL